MHRFDSPRRCVGSTGKYLQHEAIIRWGCYKLTSANSSIIPNPSEHIIADLHDRSLRVAVGESVGARRNVVPHLKNCIFLWKKSQNLQHSDQKYQ